MIIQEVHEEALVGFVYQGIALLYEKFKLARDYGYFTVYDRAVGGGILLVRKIGMPPPQKLEKYLGLSQEKAVRLSRNPGHISSFQSRKEHAGQWGGAVKANVPAANTLVLSFSGLPELHDEALMTFVGFQSGWIDRQRAETIARLSNNEHIMPILQG